MTPLETLTPTKAAEWLGIDIRTFKNLAKERGFTEYPGTSPGKIRYSKEDIAAKYMKPIEELNNPKKARGKIKI